MLEKCGIPAAEIKCYGSQVVIEALSEDAARRWFRLLQKFCSRVRGPVKTMRENKVNTNTCLLPSSHFVWMVGGTI